MGGELSSGIQIRRLEADKTGALLEGTRWQIRFNAVSLYTGLQTLDVLAEALNQLVVSLESTERRLDLMVETGKRPELDRLKVVEELEDARAQRAAIGADRTRVASLLLALMGRDPSGDVAVDPLADRCPEVMMTPAQLRAAAADNSGIHQARLAAEQGEHSVRAANSTFIPRVVVDGNFTRNEAPSLDDPLDTWQFSVGVVVPLFHGTSRFGELEAAKERQSAAREAVTQTEMDIAARLEEAMAVFDSSRAELRAARARVAAGNEAARIEQIRYDTGVGTIEEFLRAQSRKQGARASLAKALGSVMTAGESINSIVEREAVQ
jgi:outer membrane protein TolC